MCLHYSKEDDFPLLMNYVVSLPFGTSSVQKTIKLFCSQVSALTSVPLSELLHVCKNIIWKREAQPQPPDETKLKFEVHVLANTSTSPVQIIVLRTITHTHDLQYAVEIKKWDGVKMGTKDRNKIRKWCVVRFFGEAPKDVLGLLSWSVMGVSDEFDDRCSWDNQTNCSRWKRWP